MSASVEEVFHKLLTDAAPDLDGRAYPVDLPQNPEYPCAVYFIVSRVHGYTLKGPDGLKRPRFQVDFSEDYDVTRVLADQVTAALSGFRGPVTVEGSAPVQVQAIFCNNDGDMPESGVQQVGARVRRRTLDFTMTI